MTRYPGWIERLAEEKRRGDPPAWLRAAVARQQWPVEPARMLAEMAAGLGAIEARREARIRRNAPQAARAMRAYEEARQRLAGETREVPGALIAALRRRGPGHARIF
jgi:hypothetical protein